MEGKTTRGRNDSGRTGKWATRPVALQSYIAFSYYHYYYYYCNGQSKEVIYALTQTKCCKKMRLNKICLESLRVGVHICCLYTSWQYHKHISMHNFKQGSEKRCHLLFFKCPSRSLDFYGPPARICMCVQRQFHNCIETRTGRLNSLASNKTVGNFNTCRGLHTCICTWRHHLLKTYRGKHNFLFIDLPSLATVVVTGHIHPQTRWRKSGREQWCRSASSISLWVALGRAI